MKFYFSRWSQSTLKKEPILGYVFQPSEYQCTQWKFIMQQHSHCEHAWRSAKYVARTTNILLWCPFIKLGNKKTNLASPDSFKMSSKNL